MVKKRGDSILSIVRGTDWLIPAEKSGLGKKGNLTPPIGGGLKGKRISRLCVNSLLNDQGEEAEGEKFVERYPSERGKRDQSIQLQKKIKKKQKKKKKKTPIG